jgi:hypothetical protein
MIVHSCDRVNSYGVCCNYWLPAAGHFSVTHCTYFCFSYCILIYIYGNSNCTSFGRYAGIPTDNEFSYYANFLSFRRSFPLQGLPAAMEIVTRVDPPAYGVDAVRGLLTSTSQFGLLTDFSVIAVITLVFLALEAIYLKEFRYNGLDSFICFSAITIIM